MSERRSYTPEQWAKRMARQREYRRRPEVRAWLLPYKRAEAKVAYLKHRERVISRVRDYRTRNRDQIAKRKRMAYARERDRILRAQREAAPSKKDVRSARNHSYYQRNRERLLAYHREYSRKNRDKYQVWYHARRAREVKAPGRFTSAEFNALVSLHEGRCAYCGSIAPLVPDHRIPLARTGSAPTNDITNILPACVPCNTSKGDKTEDEFRYWLLKLGRPPAGRTIKQV